MTPLRFFHWTVSADVAATRSVYAQLPPCDTAATPEAAALLDELAAQRVPAALLELLAASGVDVAKPIDLWGAPEQGFLHATWWLYGTLSPVAWAGDGIDAIADVGCGAQCWLTTEAPQSPFAAQAVVQVECMLHKVGGSRAPQSA